MVYLLKAYLAVLVVCYPAAVHGQFPAACSDNANNGIKICCPGYCSGHGVCTDISTEPSVDWSKITGYGQEIVRRINETKTKSKFDNRIDARYQWPTVVFTRVCVCDKNYGGADCSECDFGYSMMNGVCVKSSPRVRKNFLSMTNQEKMDLIKVINESKNEDPTEFKWAVIVEEPDGQTGSGLRLENVSTFDLFVYHHFFSKREGDVKENNINGKQVCKTDGLDDVDFAHESSTFLTWHRYYLLLIERELGRVAERLVTSKNWDRYTFALPYWDWTDSNTAINEIFNEMYFGNFTPGEDTKDVKGGLFNDRNWYTVCDRHYQANVVLKNSVSCGYIRGPCDVNRDQRYRRHLQRGRFLVRGSDRLDKRAVPSQDSIKYLFGTNVYDAPAKDQINGSDVYSVASKGTSFRNRLEGFVGWKDESNGIFDDYGSEDTHNFFHNAVHIYIHGHMRIIPSASNDPIFYLHHANVDRLFEVWLRGRGSGTSYIPGENNRVAHPGHNSIDYLVPFFPLKTNKDMYYRSETFGYDYDALADVSDDGDDAGRLIPGLLLLLGGIISVSLLI